MIHSGYTKLFSSIVASTIWREDDKTRLVWITLLALSDRDGYVAASLPGLADLAHVSIEDCEKAIGKLQQPDKYSRSPEHDGRRIEAVEGGWLILNRAKYRDLVPAEHRREVDRLRQQRHRTKQNVGETTVTMSRVTDRDSHVTSRKTETETETETEKKNPAGQTSKNFNPTEIAAMLCKGTGWSGVKMIAALRDAIEWRAKQEPEVAIEQIGEALVNGYRGYQAEKGTFAVLPQKYFEQGLYQGAVQNSTRKKARYASYIQHVEEIEEDRKNAAVS